MDIMIRGLTKTYGRRVTALKAIDLDIPTGMFGLLGPNGAGKTTLIRILAGILRPTGGTVRVGPYDLNSGEGRLAVKRTLGYLPQELGVYPDLSAAEFLDYIALLKGVVDRTVRRRRVAALLDLVGLLPAANEKLKGFSGGMKRRVGIAQALLNDPRLLIVDEPTAGLDPEERIRFRNLLADLGGERTVILSTHIVEDIAQTCRRVGVLASGEVIFQGTAEELVEAAQGRVWTVTSTAERPAGDVAVVSTLHLGDATQYRVVGLPAAGEAALPVEPSLEDGYVWLMRQRRPLAAQRSGV